MCGFFSDARAPYIQESNQGIVRWVAALGSIGCAVSTRLIIGIMAIAGEQRLSLCCEELHDHQN